jgi:Protein of unknown function (DUF2568)
MRVANLALRFALELAALAGLAVWGLNATGGVARIGLAIAAVLAGAVVWGFWCAPKSARRLAQPGRTVVEAAVFALGAVGYAAGGHAATAAVFVALATLNWALLFAWRQDP